MMNPSITCRATLVRPFVQKYAGMKTELYDWHLALLNDVHEIRGRGVTHSAPNTPLMHPSYTPNTSLTHPSYAPNTPLIHP
jgi:hypothetical protein